MNIIRQKDSAGKDVPGQYLVIIPSLFGDAVLYGPASLEECERFILTKMRALANDLTSQLKAERDRLAAEPKQERSNGIDGP